MKPSLLYLLLGTLFLSGVTIADAREQDTIPTEYAECNNI